ncbi:MAG: RND family transporter [Candidatus Marinimicrobia bacterium]|nr:RND family transporter [Candidatus Neomarinimicrobiota bacterium]
MNKIKNYSDHPIRRWFIYQSINRPVRSIVVSLFATIVMASGLTFLVIDDDMMKMLPQNLESRKAWDSLQDEFGSTEVIFVAFGEKDHSIYHPDALRALWDVSMELEGLPEVEEVTSITTATRMDNDEGDLLIQDLQSDRVLNGIEIAGIRDYLNKYPNVKKRFISQKEDYLILLVQPYDDVALDQFRNELVGVADSILTNYEIYYGGFAYITGTIPELIRNDVQSLMKMGILIMVTILLLNLRSIPGVLMVLMVIGLSLVSMMGFMGWVYKLTGSDRFLFTMMNTSMPIILLTIANSDGVHVMAKFFKEMRLKGDVPQALATTMDSLLVPIFLTSITTVAAFLTMISSPLEPMIGYGITVSAGIIWAWFLSSVLLPAVISIKKWNLESKAIKEMSLFEKMVDHLGKVVLTHPKYVFSAGIILVVFGLFGFHKISIDVNFANFFKPGSEIRDSMNFMDQEMTGTLDLRVRIDGDMRDPHVLNDVSSLQSFLEREDKVSLSYSFADVVKQMHRTFMDDELTHYTIPDSASKIKNLITGFSNDYSSVVDDIDYESGLMTVLAKIMSTDEIFHFANKTNAYIDESLTSDISVTVTGMIIVIRDMVIMIIRSSAFSITFSLIVIGLIASVFFKRILWGILAVIPLTSAVILNFGLMGHFGVTLNHITAILSSIIIGVGVDFAIHYISQFRRLSRKVNPDQLSREVIDDVGYPIILDACSNMGFGALMFSVFLPIQYIGGLMVFAMVSTSLGTLTILSALTELLKKRLIEG